MILKLMAAGMLVLAGLGGFYPRPMCWVYVAAFMAFELWLAASLAKEGASPPATGEPPYHFSAEESQLIGRYRFYFAYPGMAQDAASVLAAVGLTSLILAPWLLYRQQLTPAFLVAVNLLLVGTLTKRLSPVMVLRIAASKGKRDALRDLEAHETAWAKIREANAKAPA